MRGPYTGVRSVIHVQQSMGLDGPIEGSITLAMRTLGILLLLAACGDDTGMMVEEDVQFEGTKTFEFGPFVVAPQQEVTSDCVQISLNNEDYANVNVVELTTGPGFHHSNWFFVPEFTFPGPDGTFKCDDRGFDQAVAAIAGGVFFAQSTQKPHEIQGFPEGVVVRIPRRHKLVSQIHLLNPSEEPLNLAPNIKVTFVKDANVTTRLAGIAFDNKAIALPPNMRSRFTIECDLSPKHQDLFDRAPDMKFYYALAHYHDLGTALTVEAVKPTGESATMFTTTALTGDALGGRIDPIFDFAGYTKIRFSCEFYNPRTTTVRYGVGDQEMCTFLAFSDSTYNWGGGELDKTVAPGNPQMVGNMMTFTNACQVLANDADRG